MQDETPSHETEFCSSIRSVPLLSRTQERELTRLAQAGDDKARDTLLWHNQRLISSIAGRYSHLGVDFMELVHEANVNLIRALPRYDPDRAAFGTWATKIVDQGIRRALTRYGRTIRIKDLPVAQIYKVLRERNRLTIEREEPVTFYAAGLSLGYTEKQLAWMDRGRGYDSSLDKSTGESTSLRDVLADPALDVEGEALESDEKVRHLKWLEEYLAELPDLEQMVIRMRYGLDGNDGATLEEIGRSLDCSREWVHQVEKRAIKWIKRAHLRRS